MHGRLKVRTTAEEAARKKKEQELKVKAYRAGMTTIFHKRDKNELDTELLGLTTQILSRNPDVNTLWNIRRECILKLEEDLEEGDKQSIYDKDLSFTEQCLMVNPKSYGAWHHRCWILENSPSPNWDKEVALCFKYLKLDERNFHCWDYRRFVVKKAGIAPEKELDFCTEKIRNNFSNYSSWHYRSKLLPLLYPHENPERPISEEKLKEELEMVLTAAFTDPNDSSAWFYQRWLLGYSQPKMDIAAFRISTDQAVLSFTNPVNLKDFTIETDLGVDISASLWTPVTEGCSYDKSWIITANFSLPNLEQNYRISCKNNDVEYALILKKISQGYCGIKCPKFEYEFGAAVIEELKNQLDSCNQLLIYEPDSKWTLLTAALLMRAVDRKGYHKTSLEYLVKLQVIDKLRKGYYADLASKWCIENILEDWINSGSYPGIINLSGLEITSLFYEQYLIIANAVDLSDNKLTERSLPKFNSFQFCQNLNISKNYFKSDVNIPKLKKLENVDLKQQKEQN